MYQALYRKYRPDNLDEVIGQEIIKKTLENAILNNRISHAYLFTGPRGTGKTSIAKIFAKTVNCTDLEGYIPCNKCVNCTQTNNKQSTDIVEIDAASNNGIDEIREIRNKVNLVPSTGKYKVYIIDEVHMLTTGAFNALLKTLEEPPSHVIFVLATTEPHKIPTTILSRCQRFDFKRISTDDLVKRLKCITENEKINIDLDAIKEIARLSDGGMRDSISLLDQTYAYNPIKITIDDVHEINGSLPAERLSNFIAMLLKQDIINLLKFIDEINASGKSLIKISEEIVNCLKNILLYKISPDYLKEITDAFEIYKELSNLVEKEKIIELISKFNMSINEIKTSSDPKLSMELLIINECSKYDKIEEVVTVNKSKDLNTIEKPKSVNLIEEKEFAPEKEMKTNEVKERNNNPIDEMQNIRINNALSKFDKKLLIEIKKSIDKLEDYLLDDNYSSVASLVMDGELKAASDEYLVFVLKTTNLTTEFNYKIIVIQEMLKKIFNKEYKVISIDNISWEIVKKNFNSKKTVFDYIEEPKNIEQSIISLSTSEEIKELDNIFGDIVEYN